MKLTQDIKDRIDNYFNNISAEDLFEIAILKYGFSEIVIDIENQKFHTQKVSFLCESNDNSYFQVSEDTYNTNLSIAS